MPYAMPYAMPCAMSCATRVPIGDFWPRLRQKFTDDFGVFHAR